MALKCNNILIMSIAYALRGDTKIDICNYINNEIEFKHINLKENKGWCVNALYCAYKGLRDFDDYQSAIDYIIQQGGDTDTNACIAGALLGAFYGFKTMMENDATKQNFDTQQKCNIDESDFKRPKIYTIQRLNKVVEFIKEIKK
jgi:ADP-ribosylglycohydrolase